MRRVAVIGCALYLAVIVAGCGGGHQGGGHDAGSPAAESTPAVEAVARLEAKSDSTLTGSATFVADGGMVTLTLEVQSTPAGEHAFHLHEIGDCSAADGTSAGGHWNPTGEDHGKWNVEPFHLGDVGNLIVGEDGTGSITLTTDLWSIGTGEASDIVGRSVIVHAAADDFTTQPTGAAGGRIGCGVIELAAD
jgi:Cu-Zn family superoxide dismutase